MKTTVFFALFMWMVSHALAVTWEHNPLLQTTSPETLRNLRAVAQQVNDNGCDINICFALQGGDFITDEEFEDQKNFVDLMTAILTTDHPGNYCAVQYGRTSRAISRLTGDKHDFLTKLHSTKRVGGLHTNIASAIGYAGFQLRPRQEDANKIVILGDGLDSVGFRPKFIAGRVRNDGTNINAVAIGGASYTGLVEIVGGDPHHVVTIDGFFELGEIIVGLVNGVCGFIL